MSEEFSELRKRHERLAKLHEVTVAAHAATASAQALEVVLRAAMQSTRADAALIALLNPTTGFLEIHVSLGLTRAAVQRKWPVSESILGLVTRSDKPACIRDTRRAPRHVSLRKQARAELAVPLDVAGRARGVLCVLADKPQAFNVADEEWLAALAVEAGQIIHRAWSFEQLQVKAQLFETLASVSQTINSTLNLDDALNVITREACALMRAKVCSVRLLDETREWLDLRASHGAGPAYRGRPRLSAAESLLGVVVRRRQPLQIANVQASGRYQNVELARREGLVALLSVPLVFAGHGVGTVSVYKAEPYVFSNDEVRILAAFAELSALAIEKARLYERTVDVEEQLRQSEKLSALGLLAAEVAHEIRNPLTVMKMLYHSLDLRFPAGDPRAKDAEILGQKIEHLNRIVDRILALARAGEPKTQPLNVNQLLDELGLLVRHKLKQHNVELVRKLDPALPSVPGDATQLEQAFLNLTLNAVEAMPHGGTLTLATRKHDAAAGQIVVEFADTGGGMTAAQRQQAFSSVLKTTKRKGTGLGLAIVQRVVEAHRGHIEIQSRRGRGTIARIVLPGS